MSRIISAAFDDLNAEQRAAVEHGLEPLLVIAGAGSGKTKTLSCRVAHLVAQGADPSRILLLTFSRRAASEMIARVGKVMAGDVRIPWAGTFHAIGARLLRELAPVIGIDAEFTIHDRSDSADLMGMVRTELGVATGAKRFPMKGTCLAIYSRVVNADEEVADALATAFPWSAPDRAGSAPAPSAAPGPSVAGGRSARYAPGRGRRGACNGRPKGTSSCRPGTTGSGRCA
jgi:DNA helicase-2/ATP-dependent DNA helicase PcrA